MKEVKKGDCLKIHCYKHNGKIHRAWEEVIVLYKDDDVLVCGNNKTKVTEHDGRSYNPNEPEIMIFYPNYWFNVIAQLRKRGVYFKCNLASPYLIDDDVIKYIDYDLDIKVFPDGSFKILDRNEYNYNIKLMNYPEDLVKVINSELNDLIKIKKSNKIPFDNNYILNYYEILNKLKNKNS